MWLHMDEHTHVIPIPPAGNTILLHFCLVTASIYAHKLLKYHPIHVVGSPHAFRQASYTTATTENEMMMD